MARWQAAPYLQQLSHEQLDAVTAPLGTVRVVAGPGSGKVRQPAGRLHCRCQAVLLLLLLLLPLSQVYPPVRDPTFP